MSKTWICDKGVGKKWWNNNMDFYTVDSYVKKWLNPEAKLIKDVEAMDDAHDVLP